MWDFFNRGKLGIPMDIFIDDVLSIPLRYLINFNDHIIKVIRYMIYRHGGSNIVPNTF